MKELTVEELQEWSAKVLMDWTIINLPPGPKYHVEPGDYWVDKENGVIVAKDNYSPASPDSPAWQILAVIKAMEKKGWRLHLIHPGIMEPEKTSAGFCDIKKILPGQYYKDENMFSAILRAAYAAVEGK